MGGIYLTQLANWLREGGCNVREYSGWQTRARGSGGYDSNPLCVMWHHTASSVSWDGQKDADYIAQGDSDAPLANLYIDRSGLVWVIAAGATNTNGKGGPLSFSRGTVPVDGMNSRAVGIEMGNNGVGEGWPQSQIDSVFRVSNIVNAKLGNQPTDISTHHNWAPDRKIDPATASAVQGPWKPGSINSNGTWNNSDTQQECQRRSGNQPPPQPPPDNGDELVRLFDGFWSRDNSDVVFAIYTDGTKLWITDPDMFNALAGLERLGGANDTQLTVRKQNDPAMFKAMGIVKGPRPSNTDEWGN